MMESRYNPTSVNHKLVVMGLTPNDVDDASLGDLLGSNATHEASIELGDDNITGNGDANGSTCVDGDVAAPGGGRRKGNALLMSGRIWRGSTPKKMARW